MAEWRLARGWSEAELAARLESARDLKRNFQLDEERLTAENGWNRHFSEAVVAAEDPGDPEEDGPFERGWELVESYAFSDPRIVKAHFDPREPLLGRRILLELQALGLHYLNAAWVAAVHTDTSEHQTVYGFRYDTLEGHIERGYEWFLLSKDHHTGVVRFRIQAVWSLGDFPNHWSRWGFRLVGRRYQRAWHRLAHLRLRQMLGATTLPPLPPPGRLVHHGVPFSPAGGPVALGQVARRHPHPELTTERDTRPSREMKHE